MILAPLAERMRPQKLDEYVGQTHLLGPDAIVRKVINNKLVPSLILWGPPGVGKTTLANLIALEVKAPFTMISAIHAGVKDVRDAIEKAEGANKFSSARSILFIDEIHRFNKSQQDALLGAVERGIITLIGATTENPSFEVNSALLSRCQVFVLEELTKDDLQKILFNAIQNDEVLKQKNIQLKETEELMRISGGDARKLLNALEIVIESSPSDSVIVTNKLVSEAIKTNLHRYDKKGEQHYDIISAFIKSVRGSDAHAAVYWLARLLDGGEDIKFIARRLIILSSEDIGLANPTALVMANNCFQAINVIGMPEARIILSQTTIYLAQSPKSNSAYMAIDDALEVVRQTGHLAVPLHLRNAPTKLMKELNYGGEYLYPHSYPGNFVQQQYMPDEINGITIYKPGENPKEKK